MDVRDRITALAELMQEYRLAEARLESDGVTVAFRRRAARAAAPVAVGSESPVEVDAYDSPSPEPSIEPASGTPIASPMAGIFYGSPSPAASPFVKEGDTVTAGQIVGLIEAMKVFNEIPATTSGTVLKIVAQSGQLVQPGETLLVIG